jgi:hypothetical protein
MNGAEKDAILPHRCYCRLANILIKSASVHTTNTLWNFSPVTVTDDWYKQGGILRMEIYFPLTLSSEACFSLKTTIVKRFGFIDHMNNNTTFPVVTPSFNWSRKQ